MKRILTFLLMVSSVVCMAQQKIYLIVDPSKNTEDSAIGHLKPEKWPLEGQRSPFHIFCFVDRTLDYWEDLGFLDYTENEPPVLTPREMDASEIDQVNHVEWETMRSSMTKEEIVQTIEDYLTNYELWIVDKSYVLESGKLLAVPSRKINFVTY